MELARVEDTVRCAIDSTIQGCSISMKRFCSSILNMTKVYKTFVRNYASKDKETRTPRFKSFKIKRKNTRNYKLPKIF